MQFQEESQKHVARSKNYDRLQTQAVFLSDFFVILSAENGQWIQQTNIGSQTMQINQKYIIIFLWMALILK